MRRGSIPVNDPEDLTPEHHGILFKTSGIVWTKYGRRFPADEEWRAGDVRIRLFKSNALGAKQLALWWNPGTEERGGFWYETWEEVEARFPGIKKYEGEKRKKK